MFKGDHPARTLGAPRFHSGLGRYETGGGVVVDCACEDVDEPTPHLDALIDRLDTHRGCLFESSYDFPGRYARWTMGFADPPLMLEAWGRRFRVGALNARGRVLLPPVEAALRACASVISLEQEAAAAAGGGQAGGLRGTVREAEAGFTEEDRSRQHSIFSVGEPAARQKRPHPPTPLPTHQGLQQRERSSDALHADAARSPCTQVVRALTALFAYDDEPQLGLYGAFGCVRPLARH